MGKKIGSQTKLKKTVLEQSLCTGCGACVGLCPYQVIYKDRTVQLFDCDLREGKCYAFCPRTPTDCEFIRKRLFDGKDLTPEIGAVRGFYLTRASDPDLRIRAQHGGTVTALLETAMDEGLIDTAIVSDRNADMEPEGRCLEDRDQLRSFTKSRYTVSSTVAAFNRIQEEGRKKVGVVATPCQALALAKMKTANATDYSKINQLKLVIGLFCGWTLSMEKMEGLLKKMAISQEAITGMDIPAGKNILEIYTKEAIIPVSMSEIENCVRTACHYCMDSTAEYADVSVGAARYAGDYEEMRGWNQVIVRSQAGKNLIDLAAKRGRLEIREAPAEGLQTLKKAAAEKKKMALKNIVKKSLSTKNLLYLNGDDPVVKRYLPDMKKMRDTP